MEKFYGANNSITSTINCKKEKEKGRERKVGKEKKVGRHWGKEGRREERKKETIDKKKVKRHVLYSSFTDIHWIIYGWDSLQNDPSGQTRCGWRYSWNKIVH